MNWRKRVLLWIKKEFVAMIVLAAALASMALVPPTPALLLGYFNFEVLTLLFCLMLVIAGVTEIGVFTHLSQTLIKRGGNLKIITLILVMLCFFSSMFITNDVALLTFVPLTLIVLSLCGATRMIYVITLQTIAANLGSMLTPVGNPQNLFLYSYYKIPVGAFFAITLPVVGLSFLILAALSLSIRNISIQVDFPEKMPRIDPKKSLLYLILFILCLLTVFKVLPYLVCLILVGGAVLLTDRKGFRRVDYGLLLTFIGFFILLGNIQSLPAIQKLASRLILDRELAAGVLLSQFISNVPAAILLSPFTERYDRLLLGTNIGGLGTLVASLASVISFKLYCASRDAKPWRFLCIFTLVNLPVLGLLLLVA